MEELAKKNKIREQKNQEKKKKKQLAKLWAKTNLFQKHKPRG